MGSVGAEGDCLILKSLSCDKWVEVVVVERPCEMFGDVVLDGGQLPPVQVLELVESQVERGEFE